MRLLQAASLSFLLALASILGAHAAPAQYGTYTHLIHTEVSVPAGGTAFLTQNQVRNFLTLTERQGGGSCNVIYDTLTNGAPTASYGDPFIAQQNRTFESNGVPVGKVQAYCSTLTVFAVAEGDSAP